MAAVKGTRKIGKKDMVHNSLCPDDRGRPETYEVRADGELLTCEPAEGAGHGAALLLVLMPSVGGDTDAVIPSEARDLSCCLKDPSLRSGLTGFGCSGATTRQ
jgi:hypothetical protein